MTVETRLKVRDRGPDDETSPSSATVGILWDFPETIDEELARVEDLEGTRAVSNSGVASCTFLPNVPERLRRDRTLFTERKEDGNRSVIAKPVSKNTKYACSRQASQESEARGGRGSSSSRYSKLNPRQFQTPITSGRSPNGSRFDRTSTTPPSAFLPIHIPFFSPDSASSQPWIRIESLTSPPITAADSPVTS